MFELSSTFQFNFNIPFTTKLVSQGLTLSVRWGKPWFVSFFQRWSNQYGMGVTYQLGIPLLRVTGFFMVDLLDNYLGRIEDEKIRDDEILARAGVAIAEELNNREQS